ncbi:flavin reductase family protein [Pseudochelatococcus sp. B33]
MNVASTAAEPKARQFAGIDAGRYRSVLGRFTTGVTVMTTAVPDGRRAGVTANSFNTVSMEPPLILWSLALKAPSLPLFRDSGHFAVNILAADQRDIALRFARPSADKFHGVAVDAGLYGPPLIRGAIAHIECRTAYRYPGGDHEIIVGEILRMDGYDGLPLVFHGGRFCGVAQDLVLDG